MGRDRDDRPIEPGEARARGNDPDAVRIEDEGREDGRSGGRSGNRRSEARGTETRERPNEVRRASADRSDDSDSSLARRDSARWGPVWAGLVTALTTFLLLELLAIGIGLVGIGPEQGAGGLVPAIVGLIAFFVGGLVAGATSAVRGAVSGLINGFLVWALGVLAILLLSSLGLGQIFGALGSVVGQIGVLQGGVDAPNVDPSQVADAARTAALAAFFGLLFSAAAAAIGGLIGGGPKEPIGYMARDRNS